MKTKQVTLIPAPQQAGLTKALTLKGEIVAYHKAATSAAEEAMENLFQCGRLLEDVKAVLKADKSTPFGKWVEQFCGFSERSAQGYCKLYQDLRDSTKAQRAALFNQHQSQRAVTAFLTDQRKPTQPDPKPAPPPVTIDAEAVEILEPDDDREPSDDEIREANGENLDADPPPPEPEKPARSGAEKVSSAKLVDDTIRTLVSPLARAILNIAKANGGKGEQYETAIDHLNEVIRSLKEMRKGTR
jgi:hypothetical protein